jgi:DNA-directed RNA polymerase specialized sigma24 family protein
MKVAQNGKSWFKEIFDKNYDNILNYLFYLSGDTALSEDLAQDVFLQLWEKRREIIDDTIRPYLFTIARNNYLKNIRSRKIQFEISLNLP